MFKYVGCSAHQPWIGKEAGRAPISVISRGYMFIFACSSHAEESGIRAFYRWGSKLVCHNDTPSDRRYISSSRKIYSFDRYVGLKATKRDSGSGWTSEGLGDFGRGHNGKKSRSPPYNGGTGPARADVNPTRNSGKFLRLNELVIEREHDTGGLCVLSEIQDELDSFSNRGKGPSGSPHKEREPGITPGKRGGIPGYPNNGDLGAKEEHNDTIGEVNDNVGLEGIHLYPDIQLSLRKLLDGRRLMKAQIVMMRTLTSNKLKPCPYVVISATGTGKTLAYLACVLNAVAHCMRCPLPTTAHDSAIGAIPQDPAAQYSPYMQESVDEAAEQYMPYSDSNEYYHDPENYQFRHRLMKGRLSGIRAKLSPKAIIIAPTNSLAYGILCAARDLCPYPNINISLVDTASPFVHINTVNIDVLITTPIPLFAHMKKNTYGMDMLQYLVVDDVNYSRIEKPGDIMSRIISKFSVLHSSSMDDHRRPYLRILFTGSTISESVMDGIYRYFPDPSIIPAPGAHKIPSRLNITTAVTTSAGLKHKLTSCVDIIKRNCALFKTFLIFCNSAESAEALTWHLLSLKYEAQLITSQIPLRNQAAIAKALTRRNSNHSEGEPVPAIPPTIYVSSGVFSFGLDTRAVDYVILFDRPRSRAEYLDRVGRVARGGHSGFASVILTKDEAKDFYKISSPARSGAN